MAKDNINKMKRQPMGWKEISANLVSDKKLMYNIYQ